MKNKIVLDLQLACDDASKVPCKSEFFRWVKCVFFSLKKKIKLTIRIVNESESCLLNMYFLNKNFPSNVLSFPFYTPLWINSTLIGDLVICKKIIEHEAKINKIPIERQMAYTVIHGSLHLIGYNHIKNDERNIMENLENKIMKKLGYI